MKPRLLFITQTAYIGGGIEEWLWALYNELESSGWDCSVGLVKGACFHHPDEYLKTYPFRKHIEIDGSLGFVEQRHASLFNTFADVDPDVIVCFNLADALYFSVNWKVQRKQDVRIVYVAHSLSPQIMNDIKSCAPNIDLVACVSKRGCNMLRDMCASEDLAIEHLPTGVPAPKQKASWNDQPFTVGYVGRLNADEKRIMDLVDVVRRTDCSVHFEVVGKGPEENELKRLLAADIQEGRVVFYGQCDRGRLYSEVYPRLQSLILFSPAEGGPIVAWEAMRHGIVPIVSDFQGRAEEGVLQHEENALVFPVGDTSRAAELLERLRANRELWLKLSSRAARIPETYHLETFGRVWRDVFEDALKRPPRLDRDVIFCFKSPGRLSAFIKSPRMRLLFWKITGRKFRHNDAGGEWPHSYNGKTGGA